MKLSIDAAILEGTLNKMNIPDISRATIRQSGDIAVTLEKESGVKFLHLEMGIPGLPPEKVGVEAQRQALADGIASRYPNMFGIPQLKQEATRFIKAFLDTDIAPTGCIPTVGSMQGSYATFMLCAALDKKKDTILFLDPGFPVQRTQTNIMGIRSEAFDIFSFRADKLRAKLESYLSQGNIAAIVYSNPNNPAWICLTDDELRTIGELATQYNTVVIEDLAYLCMDSRKALGTPFKAPFQATVSKYTDNYILLVSGSKIFSYAGERIAITVFSDKLYSREYQGLKDRFNMPRMGDAYSLAILYALSSGTSHSAQYALAAMMKAAADGTLDFVAGSGEYARRAKLTKEIFLRHGFHIVYDKDLDEDVSDGFFFTAGYGKMTGAELMNELMLYGICSLSLATTGSHQNGIRVCVSQLNEAHQFTELDERLEAFHKNNK